MQKWLVLFSSLSLLLLQGCIFVVGAAAGAAAVVSVYNHRSIESMLTDQQITNRIVKKINRVDYLQEDSHINVTTFQNMVLLTGQTPHPQWKKQTGELAASVPGVQHIYNQLTVEGPTAPLTRTGDAWITTKVKSQLLMATPSLRSSSISVITENGTVYLMGIVTRRQAAIAVDIAREVTGVQKVMKIFYYH